MMPLHTELPCFAWEDEDRFEFLKGISKLIRRMDEAHGSELDDETYVFLIWLKENDKEQEFIDGLAKNIMVMSQWKKGMPRPWTYKFCNSGCGFVVVYTSV
jgi:hypothetical protein